MGVLHTVNVMYVGLRGAVDCPQPRYFASIRGMETRHASEMLAALGHESRLAVVCLLVEAGSDGLSAGAIAQRLRVAAPTLSFHLSHLRRAGLVTRRRVGRVIQYQVNCGAIKEVLVFL